MIVLFEFLNAIYFTFTFNLKSHKIKLVLNPILVTFSTCDTIEMNCHNLLLCLPICDEWILIRFLPFCVSTFIHIYVATPLWPSVGVKPNTSKVGNLESSGTPECLEFDSKAQNYSYWDFLGVIGKVLKRRYRKWPRIGHLDICSLSYGQKKGRESNWQFDSWSLEVGNRPLPDLRIESVIRRWKDLDEGYKFCLDLIAIRPGSRKLWAPKVPGLHPGQFRDSNLGVPRKRAIWM